MMLKKICFVCQNHHPPFEMSLSDILSDYPPVDLYLIFEKSIWKNQVRRIGFFVYFELDFYSLCSLQKSIWKLIFAGQKSSLSNLIFPTWFFKNQLQINMTCDVYISYWSQKPIFKSVGGPSCHHSTTKFLSNSFQMGGVMHANLMSIWTHAIY